MSTFTITTVYYGKKIPVNTDSSYDLIISDGPFKSIWWNPIRFRPQKIINKNKDKYPVTLVLSTWLPFPLSALLCVYKYPLISSLLYRL